MADWTSKNPIYLTPAVMDGLNLGTAAGTTVLCAEPAYIKGFQVTTWKASGKFVLYNSNGTSTSVIGTLTAGTSPLNQTPYFELGFRTTAGLTVVNDADFGGIVIWGK